MDYTNPPVLTDSKKFFYFQRIFLSYHMAFLHLLLKLENNSKLAICKEHSGCKCQNSTYFAEN